MTGFHRVASSALILLSMVFRAASAFVLADQASVEAGRPLMTHPAAKAHAPCGGFLGIHKSDLKRVGLAPAAVNAGAVSAIVGGQLQTVIDSPTKTTINPATVFVQKTASLSSVSIPGTLGQSVPGGPQSTALQLGYEFSIPSPPGQAPRKLFAILSDSTGLTFDAAISRYAGEVVVALRDAGGQVAIVPLNNDVALNIIASGADIDPTPVTLNDIGRWHVVKIAVPEVTTSTYPISVSAVPGDPGFRIDIPVSHPFATLTPSERSIDGWGIGATPITVHVTRLKSPAGYKVTLSCNHGSMDPNFVVLDSQGMGTATLRSDSASSSSVLIDTDGIGGEPLMIEFSPPYVFLGCAAAGGLIGGYVQRRGRRYWLKAAIISIFTALIVTLAWAVGINLLPSAIGTSQIAKGGEAVIFVLGAISSLVGVRTLISAR